MGIKRLFSYLKPLFESRHISEFAGKRVGVDGMAWLYQAFFGFSDFEPENPLPLIRLIERKIQLLQDSKVEVG